MKPDVISILLLIYLLPKVKPDVSTCTSPIFCNGEFLHYIQMAKPFDDTKRFIDMKIKTSETEVLENFRTLKASHPIPNKKEVQKFLKKHFEEPGSDFEFVTPKDWIEEPEFIQKIEDENTKQFALKLHQKWKDLTIRVKDDVRENPEKYSMIYVPNPFVIPGGRYRELYYWDSYWIVLALLGSDMHETVRGIIENFCFLVKTFGYVPNGNRLYYLGRSQPPLLIPMMWEYLGYNEDVEFLRTNFEMLETEYKYWIKKKTSYYDADYDRKYFPVRYSHQIAEPRPELYVKDYETALMLPETERKEFYENLRAASESGWSSSSRWFNDGKDSVVQDIAPVDLNAIMCYNAQLMKALTEMYNITSSINFAKERTNFLDVMERVHWRKEYGCWFDYDLKNNKSKTSFYGSNLVPLWASCYRRGNNKIMGLFAYLKNIEITQYVGGLPTSLNDSGEYWDLPNSCPPLLQFTILGFHYINIPLAQFFAYEVASQFFRSVYTAYSEDKLIYDVYDSTTYGKKGRYGDSSEPEGFSWTIGTALHLLQLYGNLLSEADKGSCVSNILIILGPTILLYT